MNTKMVKRGLLFVLGMVIVMFVYQIMESIENGATIQWNMFTLAFAILAIGFSEIDNKKKENKKLEENEIKNK